MTWQPIETAPQRTFVLGFFGKSKGGDLYDMAVCRRGLRGWENDMGVDLDSPTHWMPLPEPPELQP